MDLNQEGNSEPILPNAQPNVNEPQTNATTPVVGSNPNQIVNNSQDVGTPVPIPTPVQSSASVPQPNIQLPQMQAPVQPIQPIQQLQSLPVNGDKKNHKKLKVTLAIFGGLITLAVVAGVIMGGFLSSTNSIDKTHRVAKNGISLLVPDGWVEATSKLNPPKEGILFFSVDDMIDDNDIGLAVFFEDQKVSGQVSDFKNDVGNDSAKIEALIEKEVLSSYIVSGDSVVSNITLNDNEFAFDATFDVPADSLFASGGHVNFRYIAYDNGKSAIVLFVYTDDIKDINKDAIKDIMYSLKFE